MTKLFFLLRVTNIDFQVNLTQLGVKDGSRKTDGLNPKNVPVWKMMEDDFPFSKKFIFRFHVNF